MKDTYINLAKKAVEEYLETSNTLTLSPSLPKGLKTRRAGVFVSLHLKNGALRGCIGTILPCQSCIAQEIIHNAISAATRDPRFPPVTKDELPNLVYSVDILSKPKPAKKEDLNPKKYGLIVSVYGGRRGLLLPDLEGVDTVEKQIEICKQKAGISEDESVTFQTFTVKRHKE